MHVLDDLGKAALRQEAILTIGVFDGVHRGHQALIREVVAQARATDRLAALVTFHPHPVTILEPERAPQVLTTPGEKLALLEALGVDLVVMLPFHRGLASLSAEDFMSEVADRLRVRELWVGPGFALGRDRLGDVGRLRELGEDLGYEVRVVDLVGPGDQEAPRAISSSRIRELVLQGRVEEASGLLGRYPSVSGEVVAGAQRGRSLGFPTANLRVRAERAVPANGVYAVFAKLGSARYPGVANVGIRPSFDNGPRTVETHILGFDEEIYGCDLVVEFVSRLRDERKYSDIGELVGQIEQDKRAAERILSAVEGDPGRMAARTAGELPACPYRFEEVDHTADRALRVWGKGLADLFVGAARGMYHLMADLDGLVSTDWREVRLQALDRETLLVQWLNELLFLTETEGLLFSDCAVRSLSDSVLEARVGGAAAPVTKAHLKAATFHNLDLVEGPAGWSTVVTFDV